MRGVSLNDFKRWANEGTWNARQAVCLFSGIEPGSFYGEYTLDESIRAKYFGVKAFVRAEFKGVHWNAIALPPSEWIAWAREAELEADSDVVDFIEKVFPLSSASDPGESLSDTPTESGEIRWPWGMHDTALLRHLAAAAEKFWTLYDPTDPTTAPTSETVAAWLVRRKVSLRVAECIAQILRADGLKTGPRR